MSEPISVWLHESASDRHSGTIELRGDTLVFHGAGQTRELAIENLRSRAGGVNDRTIFLAHPALGRAELAVAREELAGIGRLTELPAIAAALAAAPRLVRRQRILWGCIAIAAIVGLGLLGTALYALYRALV